jgi:hypothetical protein
MDSMSSAISEMSTMLRRPPALLIAAGIAAGIAGTVGGTLGNGGGPRGGRLLGRAADGGIVAGEVAAGILRPAATSASRRRMRASSASMCSRMAAASAMSPTICGLCSPVRRLRGSAMHGGSHNPPTPSPHGGRGTGRGDERPARERPATCRRCRRQRCRSCVQASAQGEPRLRLARPPEAETETGVALEAAWRCWWRRNRERDVRERAFSLLFHSKI